MDTQSNHGHWVEITPTRLSKKDQNHCWIFATYFEFPSDRDDCREYKAFLFRNNERTIFGLKEYRDWQMVDYRKLATRVIQDKEFRKSLISEDPDLPKIWKRH
jgi:N-glycosylase/DNA lyase